MAKQNPSRGGRLGLLGGSFNPVHLAHLAIADEARQRYSLDHVIFVPGGQPPHKDAVELAPAEDRYLMTVLAVADRPEFSVSRYELDKAGPSYTVETMEHYKSECPDAQLFFIAGTDSILELDTWHEPERIFELGVLIGVVRPGYTGEQAPDVAAGVEWLDMAPLDITSTDIRRRVRNGQPIDNLVPFGVLEYITETGLYKG